MSSSSPEKTLAEPSSSSVLSYLPGGATLSGWNNSFQSWRSSLGLPAPGTAEHLQKEVKATLLQNMFFDGARADLSKSLSMNPVFQVTHSFALGSQTAPPSYNFGALFANEAIFMQGGMDDGGNLTMRYNQGWGGNHVSKIQSQISSQPGHSMIQLEHDYQGADYSINVKSLNPSPLDGTGIYVGSYLQSLTKNLALGFESFLQRADPTAPSELNSQFMAKYTSTDRNWIATAQLQPSGILSATYWQKLSEKVDVAADLQVLAMPDRRDAVATLGAKYDLRFSTFRAQLDSSGKVSALLEQRFAPTFAFLVSGEIDHFKNAAKVGVGVMIESSSLTPEELGMAPMPGGGMPMPPQ
ncbi:translocase of outer mitochondrial membrane [Steccherinum ochraceum]|uniref:Translocase of outer membrane 40 kDa subunit n=1 Tax=Steccherinum ochraceum TaxID=92696 RepID=A0A4R0R6B4_9APHY|nr:translocase of outer mitochondrial membrane [Steccherinum ochraceum]